MRIPRFAKRGHHCEKIPPLASDGYSALCGVQVFRCLRATVAPAPPKAAGAVSKGLSHVRKAFQSKERLRWLLAPLRIPFGSIMGRHFEYHVKRIVHQMLCCFQPKAV